MGLKIIPDPIGRLGGGLSVVRGGAAAPVVLPWYLATGVAAANCVAAYQPKGAADLATSFKNLVNAATHLLASGDDAPTLDADGWLCDSVNARYLLSDIVVDTGNWSGIVRFSDAAAFSELFGSNQANHQFLVKVHARYQNGVTAKTVTPAMTAGVLAIAGRNGYRDGVLDATNLAAWSGTNTAPIYIGAIANGTFILTGHISAIAFYDVTLTADQVLAISTAMAAL